MTSRELLKEIEAWLSFNTEPSREETDKLRKSIKDHLTEQLHKHNVSDSFNIGDEVELVVYSVICCEICNNIIGNYIDCPVCKSNYVRTDQYCDLYDEKELMCEDCRTIFAKTSDSWYHNCKAKIVALGKY